MKAIKLDEVRGKKPTVIFPGRSSNARELGGWVEKEEVDEGKKSRAIRKSPNSRGPDLALSNQREIKCEILFHGIL